MVSNQELHHEGTKVTKGSEIILLNFVTFVPSWLVPSSSRSLRLNLFFRLEFVFLERLEGGRAGAQGIVLGDPVEHMDTAVMEQGRL